MGLEGRVHGVLCVLLWFGPRYVQLRFCDFSSRLICTPEAKAWVGEKQAACLRAPRFKKKHIAKRKSYDTENAQPLFFFGLTLPLFLMLGFGSAFPPD